MYITRNPRLRTFFLLTLAIALCGQQIGYFYTMKQYREARHILEAISAPRPVPVVTEPEEEPVHGVSCPAFSEGAWEV